MTAKRPQTAKAVRNRSAALDALVVRVLPSQAQRRCLSPQAHPATAAGGMLLSFSSEGHLGQGSGDARRAAGAAYLRELGLEPRVAPAVQSLGPESDSSDEARTLEASGLKVQSSLSACQRCLRQSSALHPVIREPLVAGCRPVMSFRGLMGRVGRVHSASLSADIVSRSTEARRSNGGRRR
jgi:hypothetical protein